MFEILGYRVWPSSIILFIQGIAALLFLWQNPIRAIFYGERLIGDRSIPGLFSKYVSSVVPTSGIFFKAAYSQDPRIKRNAYLGVLCAGLLVSGVSHWEWLRGRETPDQAVKDAGVKKLGLSILLVGIVDGVVIEWETKWMKRKMEEMEEMEKELVRLKSEIERHEAFMRNEGLVMNDRGYEEATVEGSEKFVAENENDTTTQTKKTM